MPKSVFTDAYASFLSVLIAARKDAGLSQVDLARKIGRDQPFISHIERGVRRVDLVEFYVIAKALGVDPVELFSRVAKAMPERISI